MSGTLPLLARWRRGLLAADPQPDAGNPVATEQYVAAHGGTGPQGPQGPPGPQGDPATNLVTSVAGKQGVVTLAESDVANLPASLAARPLDVDVLHRTGNETASGTKDFTGDVILTGRQRAAAGFNYVNSLAGATLNNAITIGAASINVNDSGGDWLLDGSGNINGTPPVLPILGKFADNNELFAVLAVTGAGTASCTLTIRKGVGGTARAAHPVGTAIYPQVGQYEMLSANDRPARSVANMGMTNRFFLPPTSNIVSGLWTKAAAGQVCKIGFAMPDPAATVDIEVPIATTSSQVLATLKADANGTAGCEVWWDDTGWLWNITGSYGG